MEPFHLPVARLSDLIVVLAIPILAVQLGYRDILKVAGVAGAFALWIAIVLLLRSRDGDGSPYYVPLTYLAYFIVATMAVASYFRSERIIEAFCWGQLIGFAISLAALVGQIEYGPLLETIGLRVPDHTIIPLGSLENARDKLGGLWGGGNECGNVLAIAGASALYLTRKHGKIWIYLLFFIGMAVSFFYTKSRAGLIAPLVAMIGLFVAASWSRRGVIVASAAAIAVAVLAIPAISQPVLDLLAHRTIGDQNTANNLAERAMTMANGAELAVRHPFGVVMGQRMDEMSALSDGMETPHNAIIALCYEIGLPAALLWIVGMAVLLWRPGLHPFPVLMALFAAPSMFFEELATNPAFAFVIVFVLLAGLGFLLRAPAGAARASHAAAPRPHGQATVAYR